MTPDSCDPRGWETAVVNSGGVPLDSHGTVIGVNTAITSGVEDLCFTMGSPPQDEEDRCVEQILDELVPLGSTKLISLSGPWTFVLRLLFIVSLLGLFAICWI
jgi:hypothetical protein